MEHTWNTFVPNEFRRYRYRYRYRYINIYNYVRSKLKFDSSNLISRERV